MSTLRDRKRLRNNNRLYYSHAARRVVVAIMKRRDLKSETEVVGPIMAYRMENDEYFCRDDVIYAVEKSTFDLMDLFGFFFARRKDRGSPYTSKIG